MIGREIYDQETDLGKDTTDADQIMMTDATETIEEKTVVIVGDAQDHVKGVDVRYLLLYYYSLSFL